MSRGIWYDPQVHNMGSAALSGVKFGMGLSGAIDQKKFMSDLKDAMTKLDDEEKKYNEGKAQPSEDKKIAGDALSNGISVLNAPQENDAEKYRKMMGGTFGQGIQPGRF